MLNKWWCLDPDFYGLNLILKHSPVLEKLVGYNMGLAHIIFNKSNKTLWYVTLSVVWFNTIRDFD